MSVPNAADYEKVKTLLAAALDIEPEKRAAFFAQTSAESDVIAEAQSLLEACVEAGDFLNDVSAAETIKNSFNRTDRFVGRTIDKYRVVREIGRGGMGVVLLAEREDFHQQVAVKLIKRGMDSDAILERFARERAILAALNHPFIARLTDGGTTADDTPFFVMEYVEGIPVDEFCKKNNLPEKEILELFRKVCEAVSFAHQKLIVHRDLKPSNILVMNDGTPKLLDFGIAKLLNSTDADATKTNQRVLTPAYASPEHLRGEIVGTSSDVYSLGIILEELLTGRKTLQTDEKWKSSSGGDKSAERTNRNRMSATDGSAIKGDLQNIVIKARHSDAARRYNSVERLSEDIRRYRDGLPITARKDTFSYRTAKFMRRNRYSVAVAALFIITLLGGLLTTLWQAREARREREIAERRFDNLRKMSDSLVTEINGAILNLPGSLPARRLLSKRAVEQLDALASESGGNQVLQDELAQAYFNSAQLPDMPLAEKDLTLKKAIAIYENLTAAAPQNSYYREQLAFGMITLADITKIRGSTAAALELDRNGISILEQIVGEDPQNEAHLVSLANAYFEISVIYIFKGDAQNALQTSGKGLKTVEEIRRLNPAEPELARLFDRGQIQIGTEQTMLGDYKAATGSLRRILAEYETEHIKTPNDTSINYYLWAVNRRLAVALEKNGEKDEAFRRLQAALSIMEKLLAESPQDFGYQRNTAGTQVLFGQFLLRQKQSAAAVPHFRRTLDLSNRVLESIPDSIESKIDLAQADGNLGKALMQTGKPEEGLEYLRDAIKIYREISAIDTENAQFKRDYAETCGWLGEALVKKQPAEAREFYAQSLKLWNELKQSDELNAADSAQPAAAEQKLSAFNKSKSFYDTFANSRVEWRAKIGRLHQNFEE